MQKETLLGKTLNELETICSDLGMQRFVAKQIANWLYQKNISSIDGMTNLSNESKNKLKERFELGAQSPIKFQESMDGTKKYLFEVQDHKFIEAAFIPERDRATLCVSSQVGCKMACIFCMTGKQGFRGNLSAGEIVNQITSLPERNELTNIVYMGMGEPFDNFNEVMKSLEILTSDYGLGMAPKRITVSTIGIIPEMRRFLNESKCHLAVSLHSPFDDERRILMPIQNIYPVKDVINEIKSFNFGFQRRVSFEYIMFKGINDSAKYVKELVKLLNGFKCRVNLIRFHAIPGVSLEASETNVIEEFKDALNKKGVLTTIRQSRGEDILAACGLLSTKEKMTK